MAHKSFLFFSALVNSIINGAQPYADGKEHLYRRFLGRRERFRKLRDREPWKRVHEDCRPLRVRRGYGGNTRRALRARFLHRHGICSRRQLIEPKELCNYIGGYFSEIAYDVKNGCAIRLSYAMNKSGFLIPHVKGTYKGGDGKWYFIKALNTCWRN